jgi:alkanesulfonate monooxygenase SsuD/methylene tetrahydromethanopterin reductase-like flavin-dependent oxidoreductase (luciferase family)
MGPMVKLLPLHHPVRLVEDMCVIDNLTNGRLEFGVGRGVAPIEHFWFNSNWRESRDRFEDVLGIISRALRTGEVSAEGSQFYDFRTMPMATFPVQQHIPFWYPGNPFTAGRFGFSLMWPGPIDAESYAIYVDAWNAHAGDEVRFDAPGAAPRVGCTMLLAISPTEAESLEIVQRTVTGLFRRTQNVHKFDHLVLSDEECDAALNPLRNIMAHMEDAINAGAGTVDQIAERFAGILEPGLTDYIVLQIPTGDMTLDEAKRTMDIFCSDVKPALEASA